MTTTMARVHYEIPDELHRRIKSAAALRGQTLKEFLVEALEEAAAMDEKQRAKKRAGGRPTAEHG